MASTEGSKRIDATGDGAPAAQHQGPPASSDPQVLAEHIEKTRQDLAETLDAIADKVSPKRVAECTSQKVKDGAAEAAATVKSKSAEAAASVKSGAASLKETVQEKVGGSEHGAVSSTTADTAGLPPVSAEQRFGAMPSGLSAPGVAGAAAALLVLVLFRRRRRRRRLRDYAR